MPGPKLCLEKLSTESSYLFLLRSSLLRSLQRIEGSSSSKATTLARRSLSLGDKNVSITRAGYCAFDHEEVVFEVNAADAQVANCDLRVAHMAGHTLAW